MTTPVDSPSAGADRVTIVTVLRELGAGCDAPVTIDGARLWWGAPDGAILPP